ncbi:MAG TPA: hypothetical protein VJ890_25085 [Vineibacter sp.]|nr:hypothetical protein [Vineibacter sp.]
MPIATFWFNAFIPKTVPGYTKTLAKGPHAGKTAIPLPSAARLWPGNTFKSWDAGYLSDQRGFSSTITASCRMQSIVEVEMSTLAIVKQTHRSSGTTEVDLENGAQLGYAVADMTRCKYTKLGGAPTGGGAGNTPSAPPVGTGTYGAVSVKLVGMAGDPLVGMAADIDYSGTIMFSGGSMPGTLTVSFDGKIDAFPAYDCYVMFNNVTKSMFTNSPPAGNTVASLLGNANRPIKATASFP